MLTVPSSQTIKPNPVVIPDPYKPIVLAWDEASETL